MFLANAQGLPQPYGRILPRMCFEASGAGCPPIQEHKVIRARFEIRGGEIQIGGSDLNIHFSVWAASDEELGQFREKFFCRLAKANMVRASENDALRTLTDEMAGVVRS